MMEKRKFMEPVEKFLFSLLGVVLFAMIAGMFVNRSTMHEQYDKRIKAFLAVVVSIILMIVCFVFTLVNSHHMCDNDPKSTQHSEQKR